jgi:hypothetical protein
VKISAKDGLEASSLLLEDLPHLRREWDLLVHASLSIDDPFELLTLTAPAIGFAAAARAWYAGSDFRHLSLRHRIIVTPG